MNDWTPLDKLSPEDAVRARALFSADEIHGIGDYEFQEVGGKLWRRVQPAKQTNVGAPQKKKREPRVEPPLNAGEGLMVRLSAEELKTAALPNDDSERVVKMPVGMIHESLTQPRRKYSESSMAELAATVKEHGIIQPLIVRQVSTHDAQTNIRTEKFELVAGHRRKRAAEMLKMETVPVIVRVISDEDAIEHQLIENLQRVDLDPIEEAEALHRLLELKGDAGAARHTQEKLALKIGKSASHITNCLGLLRLPKNAQDAIANDCIGASIGYLIAKVPSLQMRRRLTEEVLRGHGDGSGPLSASETSLLIKRSYVKGFRDVPFDTTLADLVPVRIEPRGEVQERVWGGACTDCPFNSANMADGDGRKFPFCTLPTCFLAKVEAHIGQAKQKAVAAGALVITGDEASRYIHHDGAPKVESGMVDLDATPLPAEVVNSKGVKKWGEMTNGEVKVKPTVVFDEKGKAHWLAPRTQAIEAAKKNGFASVFSTSTRGDQGGHGKKDEAETKRKQAEKVAAKLASAVAVHGLDALVVEIGKQGLLAEAWPAMLQLAIFHSADDALAYLINRRGLTDGDDRERIVLAYAKKLDPARLPGLVVELLLAGWVKLAGEKARGFELLAKVYALDMPAIRATAKESLAEKPKPKPKPEAPPKPVREVIADIALHRTLPEGMTLEAFAEKICGKPYADCAGTELTTVLDAVKALPPVIGKKDKRVSAATKKWSGQPKTKGKK